MECESYVWFPTPVLRETDGEYRKTTVDGGSVCGRKSWDASALYNLDYA